MTKIRFEEDGHKYFLDEIEVPSVTTILKDQRLIRFDHVDQQVLEVARDFGVAAHAVCELHDKGVLDLKTLDPDLVPYLEGWKKFISDYEASFLETEQMVYSLGWGIAGTLDRVATLKGQKGFVLIDIKSSTVMAPSTAIQTAAYQWLYDEMKGLKMIRQRWGVQLLKGTYKIHRYKGASDITVFKSAVSLYNWRRRNKLI